MGIKVYNKFVRDRIPEIIEAHIKINDEFVNRDFKGTHVTQRVYKNVTSVYVIYLIPKGYECAYINYWIAIFMFEKEWLLNRGSKCRVVGIKKVFGKECYILKLI